MNRFGYAKPNAVPDAIRQHGPQTHFIAGGTNLLDLMKENVERPEQLIDVNGLPLREVETTTEGGLRIGALVKNAEVAYPPRGAASLSAAGQGHPRRRFPAIAQHGLHRRQPAAAHPLLLLL